MKEILLDPLFLCMILGIGVSSLLLTYHFIARDAKLAEKVEKVLTGIFLFTISGATGAGISPFSKIHPAVLYNVDTTMATTLGQFIIYSSWLLILSSRLSRTLKNILNVVVLFIAKSPFLFLFLLLLSLSGFWSDTPDVTFKASFAILVITGVAIYVGKQYTWATLFRWYRWICVFVLIFSIYYSQFRPSIGRHLKGWQGILGHPNQFAFFMALTAVMWLLYAIYTPKKRRLAVIIALIAIASMLNANSGASKVVLIVLISLWFYLGFVKTLPTQWAFISVILFLIISICLTIIITNNIEAIVVEGLGKDLTLTGRTEFWPQIVDKINQRPLLGYGAGGFWQPWRGINNPAADIIVAKSGFKPPHSHNGFLDLALQLGWLGLTLFFLSFINNVAKSVKYLTQARLPEGSLPLIFLTYTIITNLTETGLFGVTSVWFWYIVLSVRLNLDTSG
jgi:exopolysaccharide production protein ExoQ